MLEPGNPGTPPPAAGIDELDALLAPYGEGQLTFDIPTGLGGLVLTFQTPASYEGLATIRRLADEKAKSILGAIRSGRLREDLKPVAPKSFDAIRDCVILGMTLVGAYTWQAPASPKHPSEPEVATISPTPIKRALDVSDWGHEAFFKMQAKVGALFAGIVATYSAKIVRIVDEAETRAIDEEGNA